MKVAELILSLSVAVLVTVAICSIGIFLGVTYLFLVNIIITDGGVEPETALYAVPAFIASLALLSLATRK